MTRKPRRNKPKRRKVFLSERPAEERSKQPAEHSAPSVEREVFTIAEFCVAHRMSEATYFKLKTMNLGPREMRSGRKITISVEAAAEWRKQREVPVTS